MSFSLACCTKKLLLFAWNCTRSELSLNLGTAADLDRKTVICTSRMHVVIRCCHTAHWTDSSVNVFPLCLCQNLDTLAYLNNFNVFLQQDGKISNPLFIFEGYIIVCFAGCFVRTCCAPRSKCQHPVCTVESWSKSVSLKCSLLKYGLFNCKHN